jgi:hypothetical protein
MWHPGNVRPCSTTEMALYRWPLRNLPQCGKPAGNRNAINPVTTLPKKAWAIFW